MPRLRDVNNEDGAEISLKLPTFDRPNETAAYAVEGLDWVRVQAWETSNAANWDSGTAKLQGSLDSYHWVDLGVSLTGDSITAKTDVTALAFIRVVKGTDASSATPVIRLIVQGEVNR